MARVVVRMAFDGKPYPEGIHTNFGSEARGEQIPLERLKTCVDLPLHQRFPFFGRRFSLRMFGEAAGEAAGAFGGALAGADA